MRILMLSKALVVGAYQRKLEEMAALPGVDLTVAVPPEWRDERGVLKLERAYTHGYKLVTTPIAFNGNYHFHYYPRIGDLIAETKPDIVHIDEEPYNFATWHALRAANRHRAKTLFFSWQNLNRRYPFPFSALESYVLRHTNYAICGNKDAVTVIQSKGYQGPVSVIPQFGVDPILFSPLPLGALPNDGRGVARSAGVRGASAIVICYAGRFVPEKGAHLLIQACAKLEGDFKLVLIGSGPQEESLRQLAIECGLGERFSIQPWMPSTEFPKFLQSVDVLVLPSVSQPNWKEQFGRVLIEAMACGVNVVGSTCGEIPNLIGDAGLVVPETNIEAITAALAQLQNDESLRESLRQKGRERVLARFTQKRVAEETVAVYRQMLSV
jgi:glycosyltransferase involved in cell wall biosynthesis